MIGTPMFSPNLKADLKVIPIVRVQTALPLCAAVPVEPKSLAFARSVVVVELVVVPL